MGMSTVQKIMVPHVRPTRSGVDGGSKAPTKGMIMMS